jgi:proteasome assembly chaperone (PAC2) family protein
MDHIEVDEVANPDLWDPVLVEGLPGVGHVGKLAAEHLLEELDAELVRRFYTDSFPPQVTVDGDGVAELASAELYAVTALEPGAADDGGDSAVDGDGDGADETTGAADRDGDESLDGNPSATPGSDRDLLVLTGDHQAGDNAGHYHLTDAFHDAASSFGVGEAYALGGVPTGELVEEYTVLGAVTDADLKPALADAGVEFRSDQPAGGIVGVSGLLLGLGGRRGFDVTCLMGETSGYLVDPKSARAVIEVLQELLGFGVGFDSLEERAEEMEEVVGKIQEMQEGQQGLPTDDDLRYIG